jgi:uridine kinase
MLAIILRGKSGSGKSTLARNLAQLVHGAIVCEADEYFVNPTTKQYSFDAAQLGAAHHYCKLKFETALKNRAPLVICANTNTTSKEYKFYLDKAKEYGYTVNVLVVENVNDTQNIHGVPQEVLERQSQNLRQSIQF